MACRHFGNILSGVVIDGLIYAALATATKALFGLIPGAVGNVLGTIPFLSGCGKSTFLKTLNRMNDLVEGCKIDERFCLTVKMFTVILK